jgi:hypothetical protein
MMKWKTRGWLSILHALENLEMHAKLLSERQRREDNLGDIEVDNNVYLLLDVKQIGHGGVGSIYMAHDSGL